MSSLHYILAIATVLVCVLLVVIILLQKGRGGGLSAAFGGGGGGSAFGAKTGDVFTWVTVAFASLYLLLNVVGNYSFRQVVEEPATPILTAPETGAPAAGEQIDFELPPVEGPQDIPPSDSPVSVQVEPLEDVEQGDNADPQAGTDTVPADEEAQPESQPEAQDQP